MQNHIQLNAVDHAMIDDILDWESNASSGTVSDSAAKYTGEMFPKDLYYGDLSEPFKCSMCEYSFANKLLLEQHLTGSHREYSTHDNVAGKVELSKVYYYIVPTDFKFSRCDEINFGFTTTETSLNHYEDTNCRFFKCSHCRYSTAIVQDLKEHCTLEHPISMPYRGDNLYSNEGSLLHRFVHELPIVPDRLKVVTVIVPMHMSII